MTPLGYTLAIALAVAQLLLPRRLGFVPLLIAACHFGSTKLWGDASTLRLVLLVGLLRAVFGGFFVWSPRNRMDLYFGIFAVIALLASLVRNPTDGNPFTFRAGFVFHVVGCYLYGRAYIRQHIDGYAKALAIVLVPLAVLMAAQQVTGVNAYHSLGAWGEANIRGERLRAQGPFRHAILAGTAGATALPLMMILWRRRRALAITGFCAGSVVVLASASSGPVMTAAVGMGCVFLWRFRRHVRLIQLAAVGMILLLEVALNKPVWHVMGRIDLVGGSTGWHRARLIDAGVAHLNEWWIAGSDYTRHWMPTGVGWSPDHADITNYYLHLGVIAGLPLLLCFVAILVRSFRSVAAAIGRMRRVRDPQEYTLWCVGSALTAHAVTFLSVSYFDQMFALFFMVVGAVPALGALQPAVVARGKAPPTPPPPRTRRVLPGGLPAPAFGQRPSA